MHTRHTNPRTQNIHVGRTHRHTKRRERHTQRQKHIKNTDRNTHMHHGHTKKHDASGRAGTKPLPLRWERARDSPSVSKSRSRFRDASDCPEEQHHLPSKEQKRKSENQKTHTQGHDRYWSKHQNIHKTPTPVTGQDVKIAFWSGGR